MFVPVVKVILFVDDIIVDFKNPLFVISFTILTILSEIYIIVIGLSSILLSK